MFIRNCAFKILHRLNTAFKLFTILLFAGTLPAIALAQTLNSNNAMTTLLPSGLYLRSGGATTQSMSRDLALYDAGNRTSTPLSVKLNVARTGHTATLLPDGTIFIYGGLGQDGFPLASAEIIDLSAKTVELIANAGLVARDKHSAALLSDGRVLITGGLSAKGEAIAQAELWNSKTRQAEPLRASLITARHSHLSHLLADSPVLISGGLDAQGKGVTDIERYDATLQRFSGVNGTNAPDLTAIPAVAEVIPPANSFDVAVDNWIVVRFNKPLQVTTLNTQTVSVLGPTGRIAIKVVPAADGMLLFVTPAMPLAPGSKHTLFVAGATDAAGIALPFFASSFKTTSVGNTAQDALPATNTFSGNTSSTSSQASGQNASVGSENSVRTTSNEAITAPALASDDDEDWIPNAQNYKGEWKSKRAQLANRTPPKRVELLREYMRQDLQRDGRLRKAKLEAKLPAVVLPAVASGVTALAGQVLKLNGRPLAGVRIKIGGQSTTSDANGEFLLTGLPVGTPVMEIDGSTASKPGKTYGRYFNQVHIEAGKLNTLPQPIWMTKLDTAHAVKIASPTIGETVITNPKLPGLEVRLPAGVVIRDADGKPVTEVSLTPVPSDQTPFFMPYGEVPVYYTLQPGGAVIQSVTGQPQAATVIYPNYSTQPHGAKFELFDYDPHGRGWYVYGTATVSADGKRIVGDKPFRLYQFTASSVASSGGTPPTKAPKNCNGVDCSCPAGSMGGDPVSCHDGLFIESNTDLVVRDVVPINLTRTYRNEDANQRSFGVGASHEHDLYLYFANMSGLTSTEIDLVLPNGGRIPFIPTTADTTYTSSGATYQSLVPGQFYMATLSFSNVGGNAFYIKLKDGTTYAFSFYASKIKWIQDRWNNVTSYTRDTSQRITRITSPNGRYIDFEYTSPTCTSCITKATDQGARSVIYEYDTAGRLLKVTNPENGVTEYSYDAATHRMLTVKDPRNSAGEVAQPKVTNEYFTSADGANWDGRVKKQTYADLSTNLFAYTFDGSGNTVQTDITRERGDVRRVEYNTKGFITRETLALGLPEQQVTTNIWDSTTNLLSSTTDALNRTTTYAYDSKGNVKTLTKKKGTAQEASWTFTYEPSFNQVATVTDPLLRTIKFTYDTLGNLIDITNLGNATHTTMTYTPSGQLETQTVYTGSKSLITRYTYDLGDLVSVTDPLNRSLNYFTDTLGRVAAVTDPLNNISFIDYDKLDRVVKQTDALNKATQYSYDPNGNLKTLTDANLHSTNYTYDSRNRVKTMTDPKAQTESYQYDLGGNLTRITDRKGQVTGMTYDGLNRLTQTGYGATPATPTAYTRTIDVTYDAGNRPYLYVDSLYGSLYRTFDGYDRLKQETTPTGQINYTYYANGLRQTQTVAGQPAVNYNYDSGNRLTQISQGTNTIAFGYDQANRRTSLTLANGVTVTYSLDDASQITKIDYNKGPLIIGNITYAYDANGRRIQMGGSLAQSKLPNAMTALYDEANRLIQFNARSFNYDNNGNLTNDGLRGYGWDAANRLTGITGAASASFQYDAIGRRVSKTVNGTQTGFLYDGANPVQELTGSTPKANLLTGGMDEYFTRTDSSGTRNFLADALGSTIALSDAAGSLMTQYSYEPYGNTSASGEASSNAFQYTGRENDGTGLYFYRARYYDPETSRFTSQDPIGFGGGLNVYAYVDGDPISKKDPRGLESFYGSPFQAPPNFDPYYQAPTPTPTASIGITGTVGSTSATWSTASNGVAWSQNFGVAVGGAVEICVNIPKPPPCPPPKSSKKWPRKPDYAFYGRGMFTAIVQTNGMICVDIGRSVGTPAGVGWNLD